MTSMRLKMVFSIVMILGLMAACSLQASEMDATPELVPPTPEPTSEPTPEPTPEKYPFEGIWFTQDRSSMLVFTAEMVYIHEFGSNREAYARIEAVDTDAEKIDALISGIMLGGKGVGYDYPGIQISYHVNGTVMEFWGQHFDFSPDEEGPVVYILDEFLN